MTELLKKFYYSLAGSVIISFWVALLYHSHGEPFFITLFVSCLIVFGMIMSTIILFNLIIKFVDL